MEGWIGRLAYHTHIHAAKIKIAEENLVESIKRQVDWQAGISHTPIPAVSLSRRLLAVNTCRHRILDSVKIADYILPRLKDIARIVNAVSCHNLLNAQGFK